MHRRSHTLASLRAAHDAPGAAPGSRASYRSRARKLAHAQGLPAPDWCAVRQGDKATAPRKARDNSRPWCRGTFRTAPDARTAPADLDPCLVAWRKAGPARGVSVGRAGVRLFEGMGSIVFSSVAEAVAAIGSSP
jgi:hypothetical protein